MRLFGSLFRLSAILFVILFGLDVSAYYDAIPAVALYPDEPPTKVTFYFSGGGPLERFTSKPGAWYALYRLPLYPNQPCAILLNHDNESERVRVFALDRSPFDTVSMKYELRMTNLDWQPFRANNARSYEAVISLPTDAAVPGIYLLVEWTPLGPADKPRPLLFQVLTANNTYMERRRPHTRWWMWGNSGSFKEQRSVVLPVPRRKDGRANF
jgi:hypothetical protein